MLKSGIYFEFSALILIVLSCLVVGYSTWCGLGFTYDSLDYFAASRSWRQTNELLNNNGSLYVFHAPLFPIILSIFSDLSFGYYYLVNIAFCAISSLCLYLSVRKFFRNSFLFLLCFASITLSVGFQMIHHFLWTESIFLLLFILHNYFLVRFLETSVQQDYWLLVIGAFLMGITKNTGFFIILSSSLILFLQTQKAAFRTAAIYGILGSSGFVWWNLFVVFSRNGDTIYVESSFFKEIDVNLYNYFDVISQWFLPSFVPSLYRFLALGLLILLLLYLFRNASISKPLKSYLILFIVYLIIMVCVIEVDSDEVERLLSIIAPWLMLVIFLSLDLHWKSLSKGIKTPVIFILSLFLAYTIVRSFKNVETWHSQECSKEIMSFYQIKSP